MNNIGQAAELTIEDILWNLFETGIAAEIGPEAVTVFTALLAYMEDGSMLPQISNERLSEITGLPVDRTEKAMATLLKCGLLEQKKSYFVPFVTGDENE